MTKLKLGNKTDHYRDHHVKLIITLTLLSTLRAEEKKILDSVMGPAVYDSRIRPAGINGTGMGQSCNEDLREALLKKFIMALEQGHVKGA